MAEEAQEDPYAAHRAKLKQFIKDQVEKLGIDSAQLDDEFRGQPVNYLLVSARYQQALEKVSLCKRDLERYTAELDAQIRQDGVKRTEKAIESMIKQDATYMSMRSRQAFLDYQAGCYQYVVRSWEQRRDMLIQLGSNFRAELSADPTLRESQRVEGGRRTEAPRPRKGKKGGGRYTEL